MALRALSAWRFAPCQHGASRLVSMALRALSARFSLRLPLVGTAPGSARRLVRESSRGATTSVRSFRRRKRSFVPGRANAESPRAEALPTSEARRAQRADKPAKQACQRNMSLSGGIRRSLALPDAGEYGYPRTIATGIPSVLPVTSSAAAASSSATARTLASIG
jgi:hypothetical protein